MRFFYFMVLILPMFTLGCLLENADEQSSLDFHRVEKDALERYINQKPLPEEPNLTIDKVVVNNEYPIEISLYNDSKFYYNLPQLGDGVGRWEYEDGRIELFAKRTLFDMYIEVLALDKKAEGVAIRFRDRFGPKTLRMTQVNVK